MNIEKIDFSKKIKEAQDEYYSDCGKNVFFKKNQKLECAHEITKKIDLDELLHYSMYIIPNTNRIFTDYTVLKTFLCLEVYVPTILKFIDLVEECLSKYGCYEYYLNLDTFTISAFERYKEIITVLYEISNQKGKCYSTHMIKCEIFNIPNIADMLLKLARPYFDNKLKETIHGYNKKDSMDVIQQIFS
jgi:hypothetical protein